MFDRVAQALATSSNERFRIIYGPGIEDVFINGDGTELNIEQALLMELKSQGYQRVVYSAPHRPMFFLDEGSSALTWPSTSKPIGSKRGEERTAHRSRVGNGPFGSRMLKSPAPSAPLSDFSQQGMGDTFLVNRLNTVMLDMRNGRSAVVLLQAEISSSTLNQGARWQVWWENGRASPPRISILASLSFLQPIWNN
jgi:hypothetical protein